MFTYKNRNIDKYCLIRIISLKSYSTFFRKKTEKEPNLGNNTLLEDSILEECLCVCACVCEHVCKRISLNLPSKRKNCNTFQRCKLTISKTIESFSLPVQRCKLIIGRNEKLVASG